MPSTQSEYPARGRVTEVRNDVVVFAPTGTNYELHLKTATPYTNATDQPVEGLIRAVARKVWTVPTGGNFVEPIMGRPRIIQGRVKWLDERTLVVHAGTNFVVEVPASSEAIDLANGVIEVGSLVNVTVLPGTTIQVPATAEAKKGEPAYATKSLR